MLGTHIVHMFIFMLKCKAKSSLFQTTTLQCREALWRESMKIQSIAKSSRAEISYEMFIHMYRLHGLLYSIKKIAWMLYTRIWEQLSLAYTVYVLVLWLIACFCSVSARDEWRNTLNATPCMGRVVWKVYTSNYYTCYVPYTYCCLKVNLYGIYILWQHNV